MHVYLTIQKRHSRWAPEGTTKTPGQVGPAKEPAQDRAVQLGFVKATVWFVLRLFFKEINRICIINRSK